MTFAFIGEFVAAMIVIVMFSEPRNITLLKRKKTNAVKDSCHESFTQWVWRSVLVWAGIALIGKGRVKARHSYEWRYPSGRQHQVRAIYA